MDISIAVADPIATYRLVIALREAGFDAEAVDRVEAWARKGGRRVLLLPLSPPEGSELLTAVRTINPEIVIVALLRHTEATAYREALKLGASGAVAWDAASEQVVKVVQAVLEDQCILPTPVAQALARVSSAGQAVPQISQRESNWLRMLANGVTVAELAREAGYSEREAYRQLHRLYQRLGARNRAEAIVKAARAGLLN